MANVILTVVTVCISLASLVGSIFGMNLVSGMEEAPYDFFVVVGVTIVGCIILFFVRFLFVLSYCLLFAIGWLIFTID